MALWANLHGGFAVGLILLAMAVAAEVIDRFVRRQRSDPALRPAGEQERSRWTRLMVVLTASIAAVAVNPHGPILLLYPFKTVSIPVLQAHILEWQPPDFRQPQLIPLLSLLLLLAVVAVIRRRHVATFELLAAGGWAALTLTAVRHAPVFALTAAPVVCRQLAGVLGPTLHRAGSDPPSMPGRRRFHLLVGAAMTAATVGWAGYQLGAESSREHLRRLAPVAAVEALRGWSTAGNLFNDYNWGGYILWTLYPDYPTFVDGRTDVFSRQIFEDYLTFWTAAPGWPGIADRYSIGVVLVPPDAPVVDALLESGWRIGYQDGQAAVLQRDPPE
jgi:hypothetical protein